MRSVTDREQLGLTYMRWSLANGQQLSMNVERAVTFELGEITAFAPPDQEWTNFRWGGGGAVADCVERIATSCAEFLREPGRLVVFEQHLVKATEPHGYLMPPLRIAAGAVYQLAPSGTPRADLVRQIKDWNNLPIFNAFLSEIGASELRDLLKAPEGSELDLAPIAQGLRAIICGAYDGEGALVWSAPTPPPRARA